MYVNVCTYIYNPSPDSFLPPCPHTLPTSALRVNPFQVGLYMILPCPILFCVWHTSISCVYYIETKFRHAFPISPASSCL